MDKRILSFLTLILILASIIPAYADLEVSEAHLRFGTLIRPKKKTLSIDFTNKSSSPFLGAVSTDASWMSISKSEIALAPGSKGELEITVDSSSLAPDDYKGTIVFSAYLGGETKKVIASCTVMEGENEPYMKVSETSLDFGEMERGSNPLKNIEIENIGSGILEISLSYPSWIISEESIKVYPQQKLPLYFRIINKDLMPDTYTGEFSLKSNGGSASLPIRMKVIPRQDDPVLSASAKIIDIGRVKQGRRGRGKFKIKNSGKNPCDVSIVYPDYVIEPEDEIKDLTKERQILLIIDTKKLPIGVTKDTIRITSKFGILDIPFKIEVYR